VSWIIILAVFLLIVLVGVLGYYFVPQYMWDFLVVDQAPQQADVIIVLSGGLDRVEHAVSLYQAGYADKILLSGSVTRSMRQQAIALGVPADHILLEDKSNTTNENALYSFKVMQSQGFKSAIVVTSPYHTRRSGIIFREHFQGINIIISSAPYDPSLARNWWKDRRMAGNVIREYLKLVYHYLFER
jgi:uncharacterized SAM-binding protein YcdF (DUF218 family)